MTYTALYRRYRPQRFADLIGQEHIGRVLAAAVARGGFVHAYLFSGPRGTGKTSAARILARAINCQQPGAQGDPCESCPSCRRFAESESMDIIEIDAASNRGIEDMRELRERVKYAPAQEKYKIYIVDEVHMLTAEAFNALLKTLEEPPEHVVFIFATTEPHKVPLPVLSRCQRFDFRRISDEDIIRHIEDIAAREQIPLTAEAARLLARKAEGGMRDAVSLLDQCAAIGQGQVDEEAVTRLLGVADSAFIRALLDSLLQRDIPAVLLAVEQLVGEGKDLRQALADLLECARNSLLENLACEQPAFPPSAYLSILQDLADTDNKMRYSLSPRISLELALIRSCGLVTAPAPESKAAPKAAAESKAAPKVAAEPKPAAKAQPKPRPAPPQLDFAAVKQDWPQVLRKLEGKNPGVSELLKSALPVAVEGRRLLLELPPGRELMLDSVNKPGQYKTLIENAVNSVFRASIEVQAHIGPPRVEEEAPPPGDGDAEQSSLF